MIKVSVFPSLCQVFSGHWTCLAVDRICPSSTLMGIYIQGGKNKVRELLGKCYKSQGCSDRRNGGAVLKGDPARLSERVASELCPERG